MRSLTIENLTIENLTGRSINRLTHKLRFASIFRLAIKAAKGVPPQPVQFLKTKVSVNQK
jgi:hypothetical protein